MHDTFLNERIYNALMKICSENKILKFNKISLTVNTDSHISAQSLREFFNQRNNQFLDDWTEIIVEKQNIGKLNAIINSVEGEYLTQDIYATEPENQRTFTLQELSRFDGKNGNPAYVAVDGTVYDVTDNPAWLTGTHFGLQAGKDLSREFASFHAGQPILNGVTVVGRLVGNE